MSRSVTAPFMLTVTALLAVSCARRRPAVRPEKGLVGYWTFDEEGGARVWDSSGLRNHGEVARAKRVTGEVGNALAFTEPGSHVRIPCRPSLNLGDALSVEAWILPRDISAHSRIILSKNDEYALRIDNPGEGNRISFFVHVGTPAATWEPRVSTKEPPALNRWQHLLAVWDGTESRLYLDGKLISRRPREGKPNPNPYPVTIGNWEYPSCHGTHFGGLIDEVRIYNYARTPPPQELSPR